MLEHRHAKLVALFTFLMLVIGGTVNIKGASLACTEPTMLCRGELLPPMKGGVLYEHGHRLWGMGLGLLQMILTALLVMRRRDLRGLAWLTFGMVCVQGTLGALTVYYKLPWYVSTAHLLFGMTYFATLLWVVYLTRPAVGPLPEERLRHRARVEALGGGRRWVMVALGAMIVQLTLGALVRHFEATLACLDMPACNLGGYWPTAFEQKLHMVHRGFGVLTAVVTTVAAVMVWRRAKGWPALRALMIAAPVVAAAQVALGVLTVLTLRRDVVAVGHFAGAMALWSTWIGAWIVTGSGKRSMVGSDAAVAESGKFAGAVL
jgi:cytochrome c oxidase assembly protein subunit 15